VRRILTAAGSVATLLAAMVSPSGVIHHRNGGSISHSPAIITRPGPSASGVSYSLLTSGGDLIGYGAAFGAPAAASSSPAVGVAATSDGQGALVADANGAVAARGDATFYGSMAGTTLTKPVVGIALDPVSGGYWLVASDGGIFSFHAPFYGSTGALELHEPIVGIVAMADGRGYRLVAADGGVFDFGDARFYGSTGDMSLVAPIVAMADTYNGRGYWLVAADGGVFTFGNARYRGSAGGEKLNAPIVGIAPTADSFGYWLAAADGGVFTFGDASFYGAGSEAGQGVVGIAADTGGYQNPLRSIVDLSSERIDQGVDYGGGGSIYAIGEGVVLNTTNSGWPGGAFISYQLEDGRAKGYIVYVAENVIPVVQIGEQVTPHTVLGTLINAYPNLETGWAAPPGTGESAAYAAGDWSSHDDEDSVPTIYGENFSELLASLGAPPGISVDPPAVGTLPAGWPTW
jgi:hypothetical protein